MDVEWYLSMVFWNDFRSREPLQQRHPFLFVRLGQVFVSCAELANGAPLPGLTLNVLGLCCQLTFLALVTTPTYASGDEGGVAFYEAKIRPLLADKCYSCHSLRAKKVRGGLRLDDREAVLAGGESGPILNTTNPNDSSILAAVRYESLQMPPQRKLTESQIRLIEQWVKRGAPMPATPARATPALEESFEITAADRAHWAYQPVSIGPTSMPTNSALPADWARNSIDHLVASQWTAHGILPNSELNRSALIRRLHFDLWGLPATAAEISAFENDARPDAYERLVDRLLASPRYGERWGRHWLDVVRFAQTNGYERDAEKPYAWRYRDYVIRAWNRDLPYDQFIREQLAGDELPDGDRHAISATGFYRLGVWDDEPDDRRAAEFDGLDDMLSTIGQVFLGQTVGCARCHDHQFDPISQVDYYELLSFVRGVRYYDKPQENSSSAVLRPFASHSELLRWREGQQTEQRKLEMQLGAAAEADRKRLEQQLNRLKQQPQPFGWTLAVRDGVQTPPATHVLIRGDAGRNGRQVEPRFLTVLDNAAPVIQPAAVNRSSGRRLALANWIVDRNNPLTARVIANRIWQHHFSAGIVDTPNDFGQAGLPPKNAKLLDWLAHELMENGWSLKYLQRQIVLSTVYRMSSSLDNEQARTVDPSNRLFWRQSLRRLDAESLRDSMLFVSGQLNFEQGGRGMFPRLDGEVVAGQSKPGLGWELSSSAQRQRRSVYTFVKRGVRDPLSEAFDYVNTTSPLGARPTTTVAPQALILLNSRFVRNNAASLARAADESSPQDWRAAVRFLVQRIQGRNPSERELELFLEYAGKQSQHYASQHRRLFFRPDVPTSLAAGFRRRLAPTDYLIGPSHGWSYHRGVWGGGYEGIEVVEAPQYPFALWSGGKFRDVELTGKLRLGQGTSRASILLRAHANGDRWQGTALSLLPAEQQLQVLTNHPATASSTAHADIPTDRWLPFRVVVADRTVTFELAGRTLLSTTQNVAAQEGQLGISSWGGTFELDDLELSNAGRSQRINRISDRIRQTQQSAPDVAQYQLFEGAWQIAEGQIHVAQHQGAKLVLSSQAAEPYEVAVDMKMHRQAANIGGLILNVREPRSGADNWFGYEVSLDAARQIVLLGEHRNNWKQLISRPAQVVPEKWHRLRCRIDGAQIEIYVDEQTEPVIRYKHERPLPSGAIGLRTWNSELSFRNLVVTRDGKEVRLRFASNRQAAAESTPAYDAELQRWTRQQALQAVALALLNSSEFLYVD